jgi:CBS domain-containing protein
VKVKDIMTGEPRTCSRDTNLAAAAALMLDGDCGILPVMEDGKLNRDQVRHRIEKFGLQTT